VGKAQHRGLVTRAETLWHQHVDGLTLDAGAAATKDTLGSRIEGFDPPGKIDADDGVGDQFEDGIKHVVLVSLACSFQAQGAGLGKRIHRLDSNWGLTLLTLVTILTSRFL
jgi:hypothetical protein